jgi:hypothetical protein
VLVSKNIKIIKPSRACIAHRRKASLIKILFKKFEINTPLGKFILCFEDNIQIDL